MATRSVFSRTVALCCAFGRPSYSANTPFALVASSCCSRQSLPRLPLSRPTRVRQFHPPASRILKDEEIGVRTVQVVNDDGTLGTPMLLRDALFSLNRQEDVLIRVAKAAYDRATVCKVISKNEFRDMQRNKAKPKSSNPGSSPPKQVELGWAIDRHDLSHRLKQMESFLDKGKRVHLLLIKKKGKRVPTVDEAKGLVETIQSWFDEFGVSQVKPMQGKLLQRVEVVLQKKSEQ